MTESKTPTGVHADGRRTATAAPAPSEESTTTIALIRYTTRPDAAEANRRLIEQVFAQLNAEETGGVRYLTLQLDDAVGFVHLVINEGADSPLLGLSTFAEFQRELGERVAVPPTRSAATVIGAYRMFE